MTARLAGILMMLALGASPIPGDREVQAELDRVAALMKDRRYDEAESASRRLLSRVEATLGAASLETASVVDALVTALWRGGKSQDPEALELAERALKIKESRLDPGDLQIVASARNAGHLLRERARYEEARLQYERARRIDEQVLGVGHLEAAWDIRYLGNVALDLGQYDDAMRLYRRALEVAGITLPPDDPDLADLEYNLAITLRRLGEYEAARPLYDHVLSVKERILTKDDPALAFFLNGYAVFLNETGDYAGARALYERVLEIRRKALGSEHVDVATALNNLSLVLARLGDDREARTGFQEALRIREKALPPDHLLVAQGLHNLAVQEAQMGDFQAARPRFEGALQIRRQALGDRHPEVATTLQRLARVLLETGDAAAAERSFDEALAIWNETLGQLHQDRAFCLQGLGNIRERAGDLAGAESLYGRALELLRQALGPDHPRVAETMYNLSGVTARAGASQRALDLALGSERIAREHLHITARFLPERLALRYAATRAESLDLALSLATEGEDRATASRVWDALIRSRSQILDEMASRHRAVSQSEDTEVRRLSEAVSVTSRRLAHLALTGPDAHGGGAYNALLQEARAKKEKAEAALAERSALFRSEREASQAGLEEVRRRLPAGSALVGFASPNRVGGRDVALVLSAGAAHPAIVPLGPAIEIDRLVLQWKREAARGHAAPGASIGEVEEAYRSAGRSLREEIWDPLVRELRGAARVFVVPDGALHLVNFASLPSGSGRYLIESGPLIEYLSAERDLVGAGDRGKTGTGLLALGDPAFNEPRSDPQGAVARHRSVCGDVGAVPSNRLPEAAREVEEIARLWREAARAKSASPGPLDVLIGPRASEAAFKEMAAGRRVLHLATHGFFLGEGCQSSGSMRGFGQIAPRGDRAETLEVIQDNPLLRSGLILAGAARLRTAAADEEDGILTAEEIASLDLRGTEWAVLSACDTGLGEVRAGEGVFGLRRAFQIAGARTVIMSLWPVEDASALRWMRALYEARFGRGLSTAESVRSACRAVLRERRAAGQGAHPFFWGAWIASTG